MIVVLMNNQRDFRIAQRERWYRIPVKTKIIPQNIKQKTAQYIAFYQTNIFKDDAYSIQWFGEIKNICISKRLELLPEEANHPNSDENYYKINFSNLQKLKKPIRSFRGRRILFIPTTYEHLINAKEINDVFYESPIEEVLWNNLKSEGINAERQYFVEYENKKYLMDFAVFCKDRNIDIECDSDEYHLSEPAVKYDKKRNNLLESFGWSVLRFTSEDVLKNMDDILIYLKRSINRHGGLENLSDKNNYMRYDVDFNQLTIFDR